MAPGFVLNQFPIDDERPALIHTGMYGLYDGVRDALAEVIDPARLAQAGTTAAESGDTATAR